MSAATPPPPAPAGRRAPIGADTGPLSPRGWWILFAGWWTFLALLFTLQRVASLTLREREVSWTEAALIGVVDSYTWALVALVAYALVRRFPLERRRIGRTAAIHLAFGIPLLLARLQLFNLLDPLLFAGPSRLSPTDRMVLALPTNLLAYVMILGAAMGIVYFRRARESAVRAARLEAEVANAQVNLLTTQLQPRFLFAALRAISTLMHRDARAADRLLALVGDLLRSTLRKSDEPEVALDDELMTMELYLEIEHARLGECFDVTWEIQPETRDARVPRMVLQPVLAQAIRAQGRSGGGAGRIVVGASRDHEELLLEVRFAADPHRAGLDAAEGAEAELNTLRLRLHQLYPGAAGLDVLRRGEQSILRVRLPVRSPDEPGLAAGAAANPPVVVEVA